MPGFPVRRGLDHPAGTHRHDGAGFLEVDGFLNDIALYDPAFNGGFVQVEVEGFGPVRFASGPRDRWDG